MAAATSILAGAAIAASVGGAALSAKSAGDASKAQVGAANQASSVERQNFLDGLELMKPAYEAGDQAREAMLYEMGIGPRPVYGGSTSFNVGDRAFGTRDEAQQYLDGLGTGGGGNVAGIPAAVVNQTVPGMPGGYLEQLAYRSRDSVPEIQPSWHIPPSFPGAPDAGWVGTANAGGGGGGAEGLSITENTVDGTPYRGFEATPGYQYQLDESQRAIERSAASRGMQLSGATLKALQANSSGLAAQEYGNYYNRLAGLAGAGQTASQNAFSGFQALGQSQGNALIQAGNARASGYLGQNQAIQSGIGGALSGLSFGLGGAGGGSSLAGLNLGAAGLGGGGSIMGAFSPGGF